ncbi:cell division topological specificity factor MinE [Buchnera aphidicola]|uniref:Cell division topological specificity factor n=1 Tax=Buchnera aphidicola subsp. Tuberolachnus salignus TaxID=98804 RepID=A0A160SWV3_BUCTT|nr:cell division topological specificity factor MinE [Buchnera aphidicola]CUR53190.1 Cell division topological specificity factor [Buchnera aphidicola (Tuberolachnus salignus)]
MSILNFFLSKQKKTASVAKKRLQIIIAEQKKYDQEPDYFPKLKNELLHVISKYVNITPDMVKIQCEKRHKNVSILELNIFLSK